MKIHREVVFFKQKIMGFSRCSSGDEVWFRDADGYKKYIWIHLNFISVHVLDTQVKISLFRISPLVNFRKCSNASLIFPDRWEP